MAGTESQLQGYTIFLKINGGVFLCIQKVCSTGEQSQSYQALTTRPEVTKEAQDYLKDESPKTTIASDGEIFRRIRQYQFTGQRERRNRWMNRLSASKASQLKQLLNVPEYQIAFDRLLPISGLWKGFRIGHLNRLNPLSCREVCHHPYILCFRQLTSSF
jgi:hypothetical protein